MHLRCLYEPHKLGIWDGNLLRITILTKFPIPLVVGRIKNSVEMAHVARLLCGAGQHQGEERPRKGKPNQCGCMFSRLSKGLGLAQTKKEHLGFLFLPAPSNAIHLTHEALNISRKQGGEYIFNIPDVQTYFEQDSLLGESRIQITIGARCTHIIFFLEGGVAMQFTNQSVFYVPGIEVILRYTRLSFSLWVVQMVE